MNKLSAFLISSSLLLVGCPGPNVVPIGGLYKPTDGEDVADEQTSVTLSEGDGEYLVEFDKVARSKTNANYEVKPITINGALVTNYAVRLKSGVIIVTTTETPVPLKEGSVTDTRRYRMVAKGRRVGSSGTKFTAEILPNGKVQITVSEGVVFVFPETDDSNPLSFNEGSVFQYDKDTLNVIYEPPVPPQPEPDQPGMPAAPGETETKNGRDGSM